MTNSLAIFEGYKIRRHYDEQTEMLQSVGDKL